VGDKLLRIREFDCGALFFSFLDCLRGEFGQNGGMMVLRLCLTKMALMGFGLFLGCGLVVAADAEPAVGGGKKEPKSALSLKNGDRVVLLGGTLVEREQRYGWLETKLALGLGDKQLVLRNLGWSGDSVFGHARSYFGPPEEGLQRLAEHLTLVKPTVVLLCYGADLAFEGLGDLPAFLTGYRKLLELIRAKAPGVRLVVLTPPPLESLLPPLPDQTQGNRNLSSLRDALRKFAQMHNVAFVDLFEAMGGMPKPGRIKKGLTENGVHYTEEGYEKLAEVLVEALGGRLPEGKLGDVSALRAEVVRKDELFFNRWRPQNETYLFGFRKHEQGQNAREIPMFDPLIEAADKRIQEIKAEILGVLP
jgi:lysophospholipase L1-like esterase